MGRKRRFNTSPGKASRILERDGYRCAYCGDHAGYVDHILPVSKGGNNDDDNLVAACYACNMKKSNKIDEELMARAFFVVATNTGALRTPVENATERPPEALEASSTDEVENSVETRRPRAPKFQVPGRCWLGMERCQHVRYTADYEIARRWVAEYQSGVPRAEAVEIA